MQMKISIGMRLQTGPWGGGNQFGISFAKYLKERGVKASFDLKDPNLDVILLSCSLTSSAYTDKNIVRYLAINNRHALVIQRINECDERKGTTGVNQRVMQANQCADHTVFISGWLRDLYLAQGFKPNRQSVLLNGANTEIFNSIGHIPWDGKGRLKFVTHHWGDNVLKGFDIYERFDKMLGESAWRDRLEFTFIGNLPDGFKLINTRHLEPQSGCELAESIRNHHVYITASQNEPAGMHHIEGATCGLPLLYRESGALPEYCKGFGLSFTEQNFEAKLKNIIDSYNYWSGKMKDYPYTSDYMSAQYYQLCVNLVASRDEIIARRQWSRRLPWLVKTLLSKQ
jgi:hypothetical protein